MSDTVKPLEWLIPYTDPVNPMICWVALDKDRVFRFDRNRVIVKQTDLKFREQIEPMRDLDFANVLSIWKTTYKIVDAFVYENLDYAGHQDETLNKTNRGYITHGTDDDDTQNALLRTHRVNLTNYESL